MRPYLSIYLLLFALSAIAAHVVAEEFGPPDRNSPGDEMIQNYLAAETAKLEPATRPEMPSAEAWQAMLPRLREEYFYMLGLWPMPEKTPLEAKITGIYQGDGFTVDMMHFQSRPQLYVTGNLYRPAIAKPGERLPAVLVLCGHANQGRDGNKTAYQFLGIWFARHGYICLTLDSLQLGEIAATHHGTYREGRWWWHSRGYTPAGVECWNGMRAIDYLIGRDDVDPQRIAVTGHSGGGAATLWISAADERVAACFPQSGMANLMAYIDGRYINGHCDCMLMYNTFQWPWTQIPALVSPRPMVFANSDQDPIFPLGSNERISNQLERIYSVFGASDRFDTMVSRGGHGYRKDLRQALYRFVNTQLRGDARPVLDSERDVVERTNTSVVGLIPAERLRVFPSDADLPRDELNSQIDRSFVPMAEVTAPAFGEFENWRSKLVDQLRQTTFRSLPQRVDAARSISRDGKTEWLTSESGIRFTIRQQGEMATDSAKRVVLWISCGNEGSATDELQRLVSPDDAVFVCCPRGTGETRWSQKNPPNYAERSLALLGRTADTGRMWDIAATARLLDERAGGRCPLVVAASGSQAALAAYAALWESTIDEVILVSPAMTHMESEAPQFLGVLRTCDIPDVLGMLAPRRLKLIGTPAEDTARVSAIYAAAGSAGALVRQDQPN